ncbi:MAG TPA: hypothetical protein VL251_02725 [Thermomonas sp.]|nr:hypothetical protein [Thermomonas sp.]
MSAAAPRPPEKWRARWRRASPARRTGLALAAAALVLLAAGLLLREPVGEWLWPDPRPAALRARAAEALRAGRLSAADGSGARELYQAALAVQPDQVAAREGLAEVALAALAQARAHLRAGRDGQARVALRLARELEAPRARVQAVDAALRAREVAHAGIDALLARAEAARLAGHLDDGDGAALPLYRRVLALEPRNQRAVEGREDALTDLLQPAARALTEGHAGTVAALVRRAEAYDPGHVVLPDLRAGLARLLERRQAQVRAALAARRFEQAAARCLALRDTGVPGAMPAACADGVVAGLAARADALAAAGDRAGAAQVLDSARRLAPRDPWVAAAGRRLLAAAARTAPAAAARAPRRAPAEARRLLAQAARAQARGDWLTPPGDNAWDLLRAARALAPGDPRVRAAWAAAGPAARACFDAALRDNRLREAGTCFDAWRQAAPADVALATARRRLAQRWVAIGDERLEAGELANARAALERARELQPGVAGGAELAARLARAAQAQR